MDRADVLDLFAEIAAEYPTFDSSDAEVDRHFKYLHDFPFEAAKQNVEQHIKTNKWPPAIADIRGKLGDQLDSQRGKEQAAAFEAQLQEWEAASSPPPAGFWEAGRQLLRRDPVGD
ncbi:hypothetical protein SAMN04487969_11933 [Paenibacillus algorifonticola]|uniref:Uncharacterized protein n=1 Tax=Paenibacillus algorifonticola TaxID=684063 RepID=A0A1I2H1M7_9BACL|nr:replicative helicase loader/inhibitor [Paenibacillus algorifonticola]SFF22631.1 hypothetical protein SAMN04487969_11933 [Paenibacillus algorifonticola]